MIRVGALHQLLLIRPPILREGVIHTQYIDRLTTEVVQHLQRVMCYGVAFVHLCGRLLGDVSVEIAIAARIDKVDIMRFRRGVAWIELGRATIDGDEFCRVLWKLYRARAVRCTGGGGASLLTLT